MKVVPNKNDREDRSSARRSSGWHNRLFGYLTGRNGIGTLGSLLFHLLVFIALSLLLLQSHPGSPFSPLDSGFSTPSELALSQEEGLALETNAAEDTPIVTPTPPIEPVRETLTAITENSLPPVENAPVSLAPIAPLPPEESLPIFLQGGSTKSRTAETRSHGIPGRKGDTTDASETAVEAGLKWLAIHQLPDGGWNFDLGARDRNDQTGLCKGQCTNSFPSVAINQFNKSRLHPSRTAATALALLPFLGAGYTHRAKEDSINPWQKTVHSGLEFLKYSSRTTEDGYDFRAGHLSQGMYIQAIVTLVFCEAWEMTHDETLRSYAQEGLRFIQMQQREDGAWRYHGRMDAGYLADVSSDTTVSAWQMLAIKSGLSAGLSFPQSALYKVSYFLDTVAAKEPGLYHYLPIKNEVGVYKMHGTTAAALLMRLYLGWQPDRNELVKGTNRVAGWIDENTGDWENAQKLFGKKEINEIRTKNGLPLFHKTEEGEILYVANLYFYYYSALLLHNIGGKQWHQSFRVIREFLVKTQATAGHETGSWLFQDQYLDDGGRLLNTALALLILETPYRYLPMYGYQ